MSTSKLNITGPYPDRKSKSALTKETTKIEDALDTLLTCLLAERERKRKANAKKPIKLTYISAADLAAMPILSDREFYRERVTEDPLAGALELAIREMGAVLFDHGGVELMGAVLERVAARHPRSYGHRATVLDHKWEGIGGAWWP